jgi:hypothetical protein
LDVLFLTVNDFLEGVLRNVSLLSKFLDRCFSIFINIPGDGLRKCHGWIISLNGVLTI